MAKHTQRRTDFTLQLSEHFPGDFDLLGTVLSPFVSRSLQPLIAACDISGRSGGKTRTSKPFFQLALRFGKFAKHNFFRGHPAKLGGKTNL